MNEGLKIDGSLVQILLRQIAVTKLHKAEYFNGIQDCLRLAAGPNTFLARSNADTLALAIVLLYQQAQHPRYNFFSPNGILELRAASPSPLRRVMEQVRAVYKEHRLIMSDTIVDRSMVRAGPDRAKVNVVELVPLASVGPVKNVRRMRSLP